LDVLRVNKFDHTDATLRVLGIVSEHVMLDIGIAASWSGVIEPLAINAVVLVVVGQILIRVKIWVKAISTMCRRCSSRSRATAFSVAKS
jgi:uncharacterized protein (DUF2062 family)